MGQVIRRVGRHGHDAWTHATASDRNRQSEYPEPFFRAAAAVIVSHVQIAGSEADADIGMPCEVRRLTEAAEHTARGPSTGQAEVGRVGRACLRAAVGRVMQVLR